MKHSTVTSSRQKVFRRLMFLASVALGTCLLSGTTSAAANKNQMEFVTADFGKVSNISQTILQRQDIQGAQGMYDWKSLEPSKGVYDFTEIKKDLEFLNGKKLFVQVQDRFFDPKKRWIPQYLLDDPLYEGGLERQTDSDVPEGGWATKQWVPA
ncbi:hypothetical protein BGZ67_007823, partial [Mortierella alpina]